MGRILEPLNNSIRSLKIAGSKCQKAYRINNFPALIMKQKAFYFCKYPTKIANKKVCVG